MDLTKLTDAEIENNLEALVAKERLRLTEILYHIREVRDRKIYLKQAYPSLHAYCVEKLKYPGDQAYRRITAMKLLDECPELKEELDQGNLNITQLGQANVYFGDLAKKDESLTSQQKAHFLVGLSGKSTRDTEKIIAAVNPESVKKDRARPITAKLTEIRFVASDELLEKLTCFKELESHALKNPNYAELIEHLADLALMQKEKTMRIKPKKHQLVPATVSEDQKGTQSSAFAAPRKENSPNDQPSIVTEPLRRHQSRHIPISIKREVYLRDQGKCTFKNSSTGKICESKKRIQYDHKVPFSMGGEHRAENLTLRCQSHNLLSAEYYFGLEKLKNLDKSEKNFKVVK